MRQHTIPTPYMVGEVHLYSTEIDGGLVLFDTGPATPQAAELLRRDLDLSRLTHVFITHCHVDHYGLAAELAATTPAEILLPRKDDIKFRRQPERLTAMAELLRECGFDSGMIDGFRTIVENNKVFPRHPERYTVAEESDVPGRLGIQLLACPGHSQSDLVYRVGNAAITGDILLRGIFQAPLLDIDFDTFNGRFRNYEAYCTSLLNLATLRDCTIHPGHRESVESLDSAILFYVGKMLDRAAGLQRYSNDLSVREVAEALFERQAVDPFFLYLKASEIIFMRDFIADPTRLRDSLEQIGLYPSVAGRFVPFLRAA